MIKYADPTMSLEVRCERLNDVLNHTLDQKEALEAKLAVVQARLDGLMEAFEKGGSLGMLQAIGADKSLPIELRVRALTAAVPYERPKLTMTATTTMPKLFDILEEAKKRQRVIEHEPEAPGPDAA
jgi:hypothetical protein